MSGLIDSGPIIAGWQRRLVPLKFQVSYRTIASVRLWLSCRSANLADRPLTPDETPLLPEAAAAATSGFAVWSQPIAAALPTLRWRGRTLVYVPRQYRRHFVDLGGDYESYLAKFSSKSRSTLKRKVKKFAEMSGGRIDWRQYRTPEQVAEFFGRALPLSEKTYQERLFQMGLGGGREFEDAALRLAAEDRIRAYLLFLGGEPIAYLYCPITDGVLVYDTLGYDPQHASVSPGTVLQLLALEALFKEKSHRLFDFTEGEGAHKEFFSTQSQLCADILILDRRAGIVAAVAAHFALSQTVAALGAGLGRLGLLARVRRMLRA